jgi:branched-chain amino acid transport system permease protein
MSTLVIALALGSVYALVAMGYNIIYTTTQVFNFAQGAIVAVATLMAFSLITNRGLPVVVVVAMCAALCAILGVVEYVIAVRPITTRSGGADLWLVSTLGISVALEAGAQLIWGADARAVPIPFLDELVWVVDGNVVVGAFVAIAMAVLAVFGLDAWYQRSRTGKAMRATAEDPTAAEARGINTRRISLMSWLLAGAVSGAAAVVMLPITLAQPALSSILAIKAFVAMAIGGFGSNRGALAGGILVGLVEVFGTQWLGPVYADPVLLVLLLLLLIFLPRGLAGRRVERVV